MMGNFTWNANGGSTWVYSRGEGSAGENVCSLFSAGLPVDVLC